MNTSTAHIHEALSQHFGYSAFRGVQLSIIQCVLSGQHVLAVLPTGAGKSICFQLPALMMPGVCIVVTPLVALMRDQVQQLMARGIAAVALHGGMGGQELIHVLQQAADGRYKFIYLSPERLQSRRWLEYLPALPINLIAIDEAHCVSQWGYDFRPAYLKIHALVAEVPGVPVLALTASATEQVRQDLVDKLGMAPARLFTQPFARPNLSYSVLSVASKLHRLIQVVQSVSGSALVYCRSRHRCQDVATELQQQGLVASFYHAGLPAQERTARQAAWVKGDCRIMVCTNAFGMGINKPDVRLVVHMDMPESLEAYYQEAGRAGRDGVKSYAVLLYCPQEDDLWMGEQVAQRFPSLAELRTVYGALASSLQVAAGTELGTQHPFSILPFAKNFGLDLRLVYNALRTLEQEGYLQFSDPLMQPAQAQVLLSHKQIRHLEDTLHPQEAVVKGLLRTYEGVLNYPVSIFERQLARHLLWPEDKVKQQLQAAARLGFISYLEAKDSPHLCFTGQRVPAHTLQINEQAYALRRQRYTQRLEAMKQYAQAGSDCRTWMLSRYFGDHTATACGICDHCLQRRQKPPTAQQARQYSQAFEHILSTQPHSTATQLQALLVPGMPSRHFWYMLAWLQEERVIEVMPNQQVRRL